MPHLEIKLCDGRIVHLAAPANGGEAELRLFLEQRGSYGETWVKIGDDEYVRYDEIVAVKLTR